MEETVMLDAFSYMLGKKAGGGGSGGANNLNIENGQGIGSIQIKGGNATGEGAVALSKTVELPSTQSDILTKDTLKVGASVTSLDAHDYQFIISNERWFDGEMKVSFTNGSYIAVRSGEIYYRADGETKAYINYYGDNVGFPIEFDEPTVVESIDCSSVYISGPDGDEEISICDFVTFKTDDIPEPEFTETKGDNSVSVGVGTSTTNEGEFASGRFNKTSPNTLFSVGNGTVEEPSNAFEVTEEGEAIAKGKKLATEDYVNGKAGTQYLSCLVGISGSGEGIAIVCNHIVLPTPSMLLSNSMSIKPEPDVCGDYQVANLEVKSTFYPGMLFNAHGNMSVYVSGTYDDCYGEHNELENTLFKLSYLPPEEYESLLNAYSYYGYEGSGYYTVYN
jgi:hypothetical protein